MKYTLKDYDLVLKELIEELKKDGINLTKHNNDGRINSIYNEEEVIKEILRIYKNIPIFKEKALSIEKQPRPRWWYDILIKDNQNNFYCPINIKISDFSNSASDNISSKEGLYFSLTGTSNETIINWSKYFQSLSENIKETNTDYFFIVFNKNDRRDIIFNSMRRLKKLTPNGNNLPFQCKWIENREIETRTFQEAKEFLINNLYKSIKKRAQIKEEFETVFINLDEST
ncbi:hypothetical protein [Mycoplasmopsis glycophila]|uniref:Restriction endonuclease n=1 Tax=Mycoplasmopsis glycophila TaxID=171285 RepID=A0A449AU77_9BACT|nr:hypothetical protein [Mycoplasmopsis glycophila]VEU70079.1 Uncharacterised protein [Mycoplasmopsis glycophila]